ncbi:hypothetical protein [Marinovum algicola]|uniref:hypothetical protein n=1 Tax=Marinovum algicola TaxID=42444 RepID=UPI0024B9039F|nr:hypothetical protein [Marinovum algicola]
MDDGLIDEVISRLMSGKEADIFVVRCGDEIRCAKVYKEAAKRNFKKAAQYREGRKVRNSRRSRAMEKGSKFGREQQEKIWQSAEVDALRRLAEAGDGLAALRMVKRLRPRGPAEHASDIAYYASIASGAGRQGLFDDFVAALYLLDPAREPKHRVSQFIRVLYPHAWAGNSLAQDALIALNGPGKLFGPMSEATRARIRQEGGARMVLALAMKDLSRDDLDAAALTRVIGYLELAERTGDLPVRTMAQSLRRSAEARQRHREAT